MEMPCGIIMSILAANNFVENERDDIALRDTLVGIKKDLEVNSFTCYRPTPKTGEDMFAKTPQVEKDYFKRALEGFIISANQAIEVKSKKDACAKWQKHLGDRFSCSTIEEKDEDVAKAFTSPDQLRYDNKSA
jgi:hypothetical protein